MASMRAVQVSRAGGEFELVERPIPEPAARHVRVKVQACGVCYSDRYAKDGLMPGIAYPRIPGHEIVGTVDALGSGATRWDLGQRVGVGWHGGHCFTCGACLKGDFINCRNRKTTGLTHDGGYAEYMITRQEAMAPVPAALSSEEAAPLLCAGITTYNALRNSGARGGDIVAIQGIGGLGHLGLQYAHRMGFRTVALSHGSAKEELARSLGAEEYINTATEDTGDRLVALGGAQVIVATAPSGEGFEALLDGLAINGTLVLLAGTSGKVEFVPAQIIRGRRSIKGWASGHADDWRATMDFSAQCGVRTMIETIPLERASEAYDKMMSNEARFRMVLTMSR